MITINQIISAYEDKGRNFMNWYIKTYNKKIDIAKFLQLDDAYKIFILVIYLEEVHGLNVVCDNFSFIVSYSMRKHKDKAVIKHVEQNNTNLIYEKNHDFMEEIDVRYRQAISYCFLKSTWLDQCPNS